MLKLWEPLADSIFEDIFTQFRDIELYYKKMELDYKKNEDGSCTLTVDVPKYKEEDLNIELTEDNVLVIKGKRKTDTSSYSVQKSFSISEEFDADSIKAELKDGVLTVSVAAKLLPKTKEVKKIPITTSK